MSVGDRQFSSPQSNRPTSTGSMGRMPLRNFSLLFLLLLPLVNPEAISSDVLSFGPESDLDRFLPAGVLDVVSPQCRKDFRRFLRSAQSEFWAIKSMFS